MSERRSGIFPLHGATVRSTSVSLPLVNARCHYHLADVYALASLVQEYSSEGLDSVTPQNVAYVFPLPPDAAVCAFRAEIDERTVHGVIKEKHRAQEDFKQAVRQGKTAALLEKQHADGVSRSNLMYSPILTVCVVFQVSLGNIHPGQHISIQFVTSFGLTLRC